MNLIYCNLKPGKHIRLRYNPELILAFIMFLLEIGTAAQGDNHAGDAQILYEQNTGAATISETIYIQTSKDIYETGEDLWFKAYILNSHYLIPSSISKILCLQLINENNNQPVWQEKYEINNSFSHGHVFIDSDLPEGNYLLTAYTGNSISWSQAEYKNTKRIIIREEIGRGFTFDASFSKSGYTNNDEIIINIKAMSYQNNPLTVDITATLLKGDQILKSIKSTTKENGTKSLSFNAKYTEPGVSVKIALEHETAEKTIVLKVPFESENSVQFNVFPEGGYLIDGIKASVAFKAVGSDGKPLDVMGSIIENGREIIQFESMHDGMGSFVFTPDIEKNYKVKLLKPDIDSLWDMPEIIETGVSLQLEEQNNRYLFFKISQNDTSSNRIITLKAQQRGIVQFITSGNLKDELNIKIPTREFTGQGIVEFTLYDMDSHPLAERLVYVHPEKKIYIETTLSNETYGTREKAKLHIKLTNEYGDPVVAHLGISVFDKAYLNSADTKNIFSHCYLSSEIRGNIHNPAYYFDSTNNDRFEVLDLLLLTQGWRRYIWANINPELKGRDFHKVFTDSVKGFMFPTRRIKRAGVANKLILAYYPEINEEEHLLITDAQGVFYLQPAHFKMGQGGYVYLNPLGNEKYQYKITLESTFDSINKYNNEVNIWYPSDIALENPPEENSMYYPGSGYIALDEVAVIAKATSQHRDKYIGHLNDLINAEFTDHYVCPHGYLTGNYKAFESDHWCDPPDSLKRKPVEGELVSLFKYVDNNNDGIVKTKAEWIIEDVKYEYPKMTAEEILELKNLYRIQGLYGAREFYSPNYDKEKNTGSIPDFRNTLLWAPNVLTDEDGTATIDFFCSDIYTDFIVNIEGVSGDGRLGSGNTEFKVLKLEPFEWE